MRLIAVSNGDVPDLSVDEKKLEFLAKEIVENVLQTTEISGEAHTCTRKHQHAEPLNMTRTRGETERDSSQQERNTPDPCTNAAMDGQRPPTPGRAWTPPAVPKGTVVRLESLATSVEIPPSTPAQKPPSPYGRNPGKNIPDTKYHCVSDFGHVTFKQRGQIDDPLLVKK